MDVALLQGMAPQWSLWRPEALLGPGFAGALCLRLSAGLAEVFLQCNVSGCKCGGQSHLWQGDSALSAAR